MSFENSVLVIILVALGYLIMAYYRFVSLRTRIDASWSDIDVQLKRRYDRIPALVDTLRGFNEYDSETLKNIMKAHQEGLSADSMEEKAAAANIISGALGKIFSLVEAYPELKANTNFLKLQDELSYLEETIQNARRYYNAIVRDYNFRIEAFPDHFIARRLQYTSRDYFELDVSELQAVKKIPKVDL